MDPRTLFALSGASLALAAFAGWRGARPFDPRKGPRLIPWRFIMVLAAAAAIGAFFQGLGAAGVGPLGR